MSTLIAEHWRHETAENSSLGHLADQLDAALAESQKSLDLILGAQVPPPSGARPESLFSDMERLLVVSRDIARRLEALRNQIGRAL